MPSHMMLRQLILDNYQVANLLGDYRATFRQHLADNLDKADWEIEGYRNPDKQRDLSIRFFWGHDHDFGEFRLPGRMGERHIHVLAEFIDRFGLPQILSGKRILDVGVWTGGTSLLLTALGAEVVALEEVKKYSDMVNYLADAFGQPKLTCRPMSIYDFDEQDAYDYIIYSGVIYHVTDPVLSLRILFNALKDGGRIFVESFAVKVDPGMPPLAMIEGPSVTQGGDKQNLDRGGWNYFIPSGKGLHMWMETAGFEQIDVGDIDQSGRIMCAATRTKHEDILRAGLSRPSIR